MWTGAPENPATPTAMQITAVLVAGVAMVERVATLLEAVPEATRTGAVTAPTSSSTSTWEPCSEERDKPDLRSILRQWSALFAV